MENSPNKKNIETTCPNCQEIFTLPDLHEKQFPCPKCAFPVKNLRMFAANRPLSINFKAVISGSLKILFVFGSLWLILYSIDLILKKVLVKEGISQFLTDSMLSTTIPVEIRGSTIEEGFKILENYQIYFPEKPFTLAHLVTINSQNRNAKAFLQELLQAEFPNRKYKIESFPKKPKGFEFLIYEEK